jgi:hypothetical protein
MKEMCCGSKIEAAVYIQKSKGFSKKILLMSKILFMKMHQPYGDFNNDKINDLLASGGGENASNLQDRLYVAMNYQ